MQTRLSLEDNWFFRLGDCFSGKPDDFSSEQWTTVTIPHDWSILYPLDENNPTGDGGGYAMTGIGWYVTQFASPAAIAGKRVYLRFEGIYMDSSVYLNGTLVGGHAYGYSEFVVDITNAIIPGKNLLAVRVNNSNQPNSRWYTGSGIYRKVWLEVKESVHIAYGGAFFMVGGLFNDNTMARLLLRTPVENHTDTAVHVLVEHRLIDTTGVVVLSSAVTLQVAANDTAQSMVGPVLENPKLWSNTDPYLYTLDTVISVDGKSDQHRCRVGIRTATFDCDRGFLLNGESVKIKGMCVHHDGGLTGAVFYRDTWVRRLRLLKDMGCNGIRCAHNPPAIELLELCDEMGFLVMDEAFDEWQMTKLKSTAYGYNNSLNYGYGEFFAANARNDLLTMLHRDRNHPSIVIWSIGNEIHEQTVESGVNTLLMLQDICHKEDPSRKVCLACDYIVAPAPYTAREDFLCALDVVGYNYVARWGMRAETLYEEDRIKFPNRCMLGSENPSAGGARGDYDPSRSRSDWHNYTTASLTHEFLWRYTMSRDYVAGDYLWTGIDYLGEAHWPLKGSRAGAIDTAGFPKDTYYYFRSIWNNQDTTLHLLPHWNWHGHEGDFIPVLAYTDCDEVSLYLNGRLVGTKGYDCPNLGSLTAWNVRAKDTRPTTHDLHLSWDVPYQPGELRAVGYKDGKVAAEVVVKTTGSPARLAVTADCLQPTPGGLVHLEIEALDKDGLAVPTADNVVQVELDGPARLIGLDNGNMGDLALFGNSKRALHAGKLLCVIQALGVGVIQLRLKGDGVEATEIALQAVCR